MSKINYLAAIKAGITLLVISAFATMVVFLPEAAIVITGIAAIASCFYAFYVAFDD